MQHDGVVVGCSREVLEACAAIIQERAKHIHLTAAEWRVGGAGPTGVEVRLHTTDDGGATGVVVAVVEDEGAANRRQGADLETIGSGQDIEVRHRDAEVIAVATEAVHTQARIQGIGHTCAEGCGGVGVVAGHGQLEGAIAKDGQIQRLIVGVGDQEQAR